MSRRWPGSVGAIAAAIERGETNVPALLDEVRTALERTEAGSRPLNAFISVDLEAKESGGERRGPLAGVPIAVKDNIATLELPTTCASRLLEGYLSPFEATAVERLRRAGAQIVGKTNLDEFAMGSSTEFSAFGPTRNPWDRNRVAGGSSGGSAAAVAAGIVPAALGSDTGGSVRQPAAFCGIVGFKPTYGRVSRYGLVAHASSLEQIGVMARTVEDAALVLEIIAGHDPLDSTSASLPVPALRAPDPDHSLEGIVVGVPAEYFSEQVHPEVLARCREALRHLEEAGAELRDVSLPTSAYATPAYYVLSPAEAASNLARFDGVRYGTRASGVHDLDALYERTRALFGPEVKRRILLGTLLTSGTHCEERFVRAQRVRRRIVQDFQEVFASGVQALFTPTTPAPAFPLGVCRDDVDQQYESDVFTVAANLAGLPALSLPIGLAEGLPVGGQLLAPPFAEELLVRIARRLEAASTFLIPDSVEAGDANPKHRR